jgi:hypothetical protein
MVKKMLTAEGLYELQDEDMIARRGFEAFFAHDLLAYADDEETNLCWNRVESELLLPVYAKRIFSTLDGS